MALSTETRPASRSGSIGRAQRAAAAIRQLTESLRTIGAHRHILHELDVPELRALDAELQKFRERVAWARDVALAHAVAADDADPTVRGR